MSYLMQGYMMPSRRSPGGIHNRNVLSEQSWFIVGIGRKYTISFGRLKHVKDWEPSTTLRSNLPPSGKRARPYLLPRLDW